MMNKESIKNVIENNGSIEVPFKIKINEWYGQLKISKLSKNEYVIQTDKDFKRFNLNF